MKTGGILLALCLVTVMILTCEGRHIKTSICLHNTIMSENINLNKKISEFIKLFPDNITKTSLLTGTLMDDFMANCTTRRHLLSFYTEEVLSVGKVHKEATKYGINEDLQKIEDMLLSCPTRCTSNEETESIKKFRKKTNKINMEHRWNKAVSEIGTLLRWIYLFLHKLKK